MPKSPRPHETLVHQIERHGYRPICINPFRAYVVPEGTGIDSRQVILFSVSVPDWWRKNEAIFADNQMHTKPPQPREEAENATHETKA